MLRIFLVFLAVLLGNPVHAREPRVAANSAMMLDPDAQDPAQRRRREDLRELLKQYPDATPAAARKLNSEQRAALRQQLRDQAQVLSK